MVATRFDRLIRDLATNTHRRTLLQATVALGAGRFGAAFMAETAEAKNKKKRCRTLKQGCQPGNKKKKCCQGLGCAKKFGLGDFFCCKQIQATCTDISECCSDLDCAGVTGLEGDRCCKSVQSQCHVKADCCGNLACVAGKCANS